MATPGRRKLPASRKPLAKSKPSARSKPSAGSKHPASAKPSADGKLKVDQRAATSAGPRDRRASPRYTSATAVALDALRTGIVPAVRRHGRERLEIPSEDETIRVGDPDDSSLANEYVGEETPGGSSPTPDQNSVDDIGRVYGLQEEDAGPLRAGADVLGRRDKRRPELTPPRRRRL